MRRGVLLLLAVLLAPWARASAQLQVTGTRNLNFGALIPGVVRTIAPTDPVSSGLYDITVPNGTRLRLDFTLPTQLVGPGGAVIPLTFQNNDALLIETGPGAVPQNQNPKSMKPYTMLYGNRLL